MLVLELTPGRSIGAFYLGMPISEAISFIQQKNKIISHAELKYAENEPLGTDIVVDLNEDGIILRFEPKTQKLRTVEVYEVPKVTLSYSGTVFSANDRPPTLVNVYETFGPTHPGEYDNNNGIYSLHYPGLSFSFPIPKKYEKLYANSEEIPPMEFPDRTTPVTSRIYLFNGSDAAHSEIPPPTIKSFYFEQVNASATEGLYFCGRKCSLNFQSTTQDVLSILGSPSRVFYKTEDKMKIHTSSYNGLGCEDYFYNYFSMGIDILFDIHTHVVKKFILHTNFPSHFEFNQYVKCNFRLASIAEGPKITSEEFDSQKGLVSPDTKWAEVQKELGPCGKPVVHNKGSNTNPFGATLFYGYKGIIFEVMQNNHLASVCLFPS
eukprot:TRINITY_DN8044_c0_g1_i1.p1 TRINITY_DN8044_c0_g1~~TRINITY_DN8044_c0_g1_i1.p1  ORF type:complete len:378 (-),score=75.71 TRINITY_DN8044_c0_g1_i1:52-1185(-)